MRLSRPVWGALAFWALPFPTQAAPPPGILSFTLEETPAQVLRLLGQPVQVDDSGPVYRSWFYQIGNRDSHDFSHVLCFRGSASQLISVTRNFDEPQNVDALLPAAQTFAYQWPAAGSAQFLVRVRQLSGDRLLIAMGTARPGDRTTQLMLIRRSALPFFLPWLDEQWKSARPTCTQAR